MNTDDKIRAILQLEADAVEPSAAGWDAIQDGIAARRSRSWWTRGLVAAGAAAAVVGGVLYAAADPSPRGIEQTPATQGPAITDPTGSPTPSVTATPPTVPSPEYAPDDPLAAIWPLTTGAELTAWQADPSTYPSLKTAAASATAFARTYLGIAEPQVRGVDGSYGVNRFDVLREGQLVTTVLMRGYGADGTAPFLPVEATAPNLSIARPEAGGTLRSPGEVTGVVEAVDPALDVVVRADTGAVAPVQLTRVRAAVGPQGWTARVGFETSARTGSVLVTNASLRDGGVGSAAAVPVVFATQPLPGPKAMVAARDGRVAVLSTVTGEVVRWLTPATQDAFDPFLSPDGKTVYYAVNTDPGAEGANRDCAAETWSVPAAGGAPTRLSEEAAGAHSPSTNGSKVAWVATVCDHDGPRQEIVVDGQALVKTGPAEGHVLSHPAVSSRFVVYVTRKDTTTTLHSADLYGEFADATAAAPEGCSWEAVTVGAKDSNDREQVFATASCSPRDEVVETRLYRYDADLRGRTLVTTLHLLGVRSVDFAGDALVIGTTSARYGDQAYAWVDGKLRQVPGEAQRPTWS